MIMIPTDTSNEYKRLLEATKKQILSTRVIVLGQHAKHK